MSIFHEILLVDPGDGKPQRIEIDGKELRGVTEVRVSMKAHHRPEVTITLLPQVLRFDGRLTDVLIERGVELLTHAPPEDVEMSTVVDAVKRAHDEAAARGYRL